VLYFNEREIRVIYKVTRGSTVNIINIICEHGFNILKYKDKYTIGWYSGDPGL